MKNSKALFLLPVVLLLSFNAAIEEEKTVYICKTKSSKKYHYRKNCRGLSRCSTTIEKVTLKKAKASKKTLCGWED